MDKHYCAKIEGGEEIHVRLDLEGTTIKSHDWTVIGSLPLLKAARSLKSNFPTSTTELQVPSGTSSSLLLLKELILKIKGEWNAGDDDPEICHCRKISQRNIDRAILLGAHSLEKVRKRTSANTGCGACMPDVQALITKRIS